MQNKYRKKIKPDEQLGHIQQVQENESYLVRFYTCCTMIPIMLILGTLFYTFWYLSPKSQNLRIYQQDIFRWNEAHMADLMSNLEFQYNVVPAGPKAST